MKKDIENRTDIELLVDRFYTKVVVDTLLAPIFGEIAKVNWSTHIPAMNNFWENVILFSGTYEGNPMNLHKHLQHIAPLREAHFDQWDQLFIGTIDELFVGEKANLAKQRALSISGIIQKKILEQVSRRDAKEQSS
ncbi:MAG: group hemoglobin [Ferruginibacter sp.]|nr:group hemoglobin [Ferruginibacter sp.]